MPRFSWLALAAGCAVTPIDTAEFEAAGKGSGSAESCFVCAKWDIIEDADAVLPPYRYERRQRWTQDTACLVQGWHDVIEGRWSSMTQQVEVVDPSDCDLHQCKATWRYQSTTLDYDYADDRPDGSPKVVTDSMTYKPSTTVPCRFYVDYTLISTRTSVPASDPDATHMHWVTTWNETQATDFVR